MLSIMMHHQSTDLLKGSVDLSLLQQFGNVHLCLVWVRRHRHGRRGTRTQCHLKLLS